MSPLTNLDRFFFYIFLPSLTAYALWWSRHYFKTKQPYYKHKQLRSNYLDTAGKRIFANMSLGISFLALITFFYLYILNVRLVSDLRWEFIILFSIVFLSFIFGFGIGTHTATLTFKTLIPHQLGPEFNQLKKALNFFHYPFSHKLFHTSVLLILYLLTLLDLFRGKALDINSTQTALAIFAGISLGTIGTIFFIITKSYNTIIKTCTVIIISLIFVTFTESRNLLNHPVALLFTTMFATLLVQFLVKKQTRINLRNPVKKFVRAWFNWDIDQI